MALCSAFVGQKLWLDFDGAKGSGKGKNIVLLAGDEEYRSEEGLPQLAKILSSRFGFHCTVLFSINKQGEIDPNTKDNQPGIEALDKADLCILLLRFRAWPDEQMKHFADYYLAGKPIIGLRTSTHAFNYPAESASPFARYSWQSRIWPGGFGKQVLGETWISHWGIHGTEGTRAIPATKAVIPILRGVDDIFVTTDVYEANPPADAKVLLRGFVCSTLDPKSALSNRRKVRQDKGEQGVNDPPMPIAWTRDITNEVGKKNRIVTTTMGAATDLLNPGFRRLLVNSVFWATCLEIKGKASVDLVGSYNPSPFGFDKFKKGVKPSDLL